MFTHTVTHLVERVGELRAWVDEIIDIERSVDWHKLWLTTGFCKCFLIKKKKSLFMLTHLAVGSCSLIGLMETKHWAVLQIFSSRLFVHTIHADVYFCDRDICKQGIMSPMCPGSIWCHGELSLLTLKNDLSARFGGCWNCVRDSPSSVLTAQ